MRTAFGGAGAWLPEPRVERQRPLPAVAARGVAGLWAETRPLVEERCKLVEPRAHLDVEVPFDVHQVEIVEALQQCFELGTRKRRVEVALPRASSQVLRVLVGQVGHAIFSAGLVVHSVLQLMFFSPHLQRRQKFCQAAKV